MAKPKTAGKHSNASNREVYYLHDTLVMPAVGFAAAAGSPNVPCSLDNPARACG